MIHRCCEGEKDAGTVCFNQIINVSLLLLTCHFCSCSITILCHQKHFCFVKCCVFVCFQFSFFFPFCFIELLLCLCALAAFFYFLSCSRFDLSGKNPKSQKAHEALLYKAGIKGNIWLCESNEHHHLNIWLSGTFDVT